jgi:hypothetical protein
MHKPLKDWNAAYVEGINAREVADTIRPRPLPKPEETQDSQNSHFAEPAWPILHEAAYYGLAGEVVRSILCRTFSALESRCPDLVPPARWQQAIEDGRAFLARWGRQAEALGWTARDLFGLHQPTAKPHPSYSRLSRYDHTGLVWLLQGRPVLALTDRRAAIENATGAITIYRRFNKPGFGPLGDSLDDLQ